MIAKFMDNHFKKLAYVLLHPYDLLKGDWMPLDYVTVSNQEHFLNGLSRLPRDKEKYKERVRKGSAINVDPPLEIRDYQGVWLTFENEIYIASRQKNFPPCDDHNKTLVTRLSEEQLGLVRKAYGLKSTNENLLQ
jgi:hypothetical protein